MSELVTYINGEMVPHSQAVGQLTDGDAKNAGGFYDTERTFDGRVFKLRRHLERLYGSLELAKLDAGISIDDMEATTLEVVETNRQQLKASDEFVVTQVVTKKPDESVDLVIFCESMDFTSFARNYSNGVRIVTPATYAVPAQTAGEIARQAGQPTFSLLADSEGNITECNHANFMFVHEGRIKLPDRSSVLPGVSMETVLELAETMNIPVDEGEYTPLHVYECDEAFVSSTRFCILPVATLNGLSLGAEMPGPVWKSLIRAWSELVGVDIVKQAMKHFQSFDTVIVSTD